MQLLVISPTSCDDPSAWPVQSSLAQEYGRRGHDVTLAGQHKPYLDKPSEEPAPWGRIVRLGGSTQSRALHSLTMLWRSLGCLRACDFAHVRVNGQADFRMLLLLWACRLSGVGYGVSFDDFDNPSHHPRSTDAWWRLRLLERLLSPAHWITANSRFIAAKLVAAMPSLKDRVTVVACGVCARPADPSGRRPFVLCLARLMPYKGIDVLLLAWKDLCARFADVTLVIYGHDDSFGHYPRLAGALGLAGRVQFQTRQDEGEKWRLLHGCLFAVSASRHEAFGVAILEAMSCGKAVLATRAGGPEEIVEDGKTGLLADSFDAPALAAGMSRLLSDPCLRDRLGVNARAAVASYSWEKAVDRFLAETRAPSR